MLTLIGMPSMPSSQTKIFESTLRFELSNRIGPVRPSLMTSSKGIEIVGGIASPLIVARCLWLSVFACKRQATRTASKIRPNCRVCSRCRFIDFHEFTKCS
uniref:Uncharacterized protein n=1 Tax=Parascaris equorum TaxID=6256 RepID=A0A914S4H3_PAREQ